MGESGGLNRTISYDTVPTGYLNQAVRGPAAVAVSAGVESMLET